MTHQIGNLKRLTSLAATLAFVLAQQSALAADAVSPTATNGVSVVGRILGMALFGYLAMRIFRRRGEDDEEDEGYGLTRRVKLRCLFLVIVIGILVMVWVTS